MFAGHDQLVFELLAGQRQVGMAALQAAFAAHQASDRTFASTVLDLGLLDKPALLRVVADHLGLEFVADPPTSLPDDARSLVSEGLARSHGVVPVAADGSSVKLLAVDPFEPSLASDLAFALGREVRVAVADPDRVTRLIRRHYGDGEVPDDAPPPTLRSSPGDPGGAGGLTEADIEQLAGQPPIIRFVNLVLTQAIRSRASDVHFEPFADEFRIRYRIDGALHAMSPPARNLALPVISRLKVLANLNIAERRLPQDGRLRVNAGGRAVDLRVSTLPTQFGESVVLRVLDQAMVRLELNQLGLPAAIQAAVEEVIRRPNGIFLATGPTGSGKTTTLYSCLQALNVTGSKLLTVEDPVEYEIDGVMQVPVNPAAGLTFAPALRTFLRQDPDIVMVGEIRDLETAQISIQAALTGHLVLSTLHTNDAPGTVTRLVDMGIEPFLLASTVEAVLAQRLLRRVCPSCRVAYEPDEPLLRQLGGDPSRLRGQNFFRAAGCAHCARLGYQGRVGLFEFLRMTDPLRELIVAGAALGELRKLALREGMSTLRDAGLAAVLAGATTVEEVIKHT